MTHCPSSERLRQLLADELSGPEADVVETHLEVCAGCQEALEQLTAGTHAGRPPDDRTRSASTFLRQLQEEPPTGTWPGPGPNQRAKGETPPAPLAVVRVAGRGATTVSEIATLLRKRLRFLAAVIWATFALYAIFTAVFSPEPFTLALYVLALVATVPLIGLLRGARPLSMPALRWIEVLFFGGVALFFSWIHRLCFASGWFATGVERDWPIVLLSARALSLNWVLLMVGYGLLIPNTWRRCAVVVGVMAVWPVLLNAVLVPWDLPLGQRLLFLLESALNMALGAAVSVYGSYRIETLREQAAQARTVGPYRLKQCLGAGGMGEVYLAEHRLLRRPCAVKLIRPERAGDPQYLRRFEREVQAMATLSHPNTVEVFDYGHADDGTFYYVMEYLPGLSLEELVQRHGPQPPERVVHLLRQVCGALREAHAIGLVHRDIKPGNVLVCERGGVPDVVKLLDFGMVRSLAPDEDVTKLTQEGMITGTPAYMSPEQAAGRARLDARSDLYSLAAVAYFLLTGQPPFVRATAVQTLAAHLGETVIPPDRVRSDVPADLQAVVLRGLEKDPGRRFTDVGAMDRALAACACAGGWTQERAADWWAAREERTPRALGAGRP